MIDNMNLGMDEKLVITSGRRYIDIDAYASIIAYRELLRALGYDAYAASSATINQSVPPLIRNLGYRLDDELPDGAKYIIVDVSNPDFFDRMVRDDGIIEVIDHHTGFEGYWQDRGVRHQIEFIGSVCTMIFERIVNNIGGGH